MQQVTVGARYQIVIPKETRKKISGLRPGMKIAIQHIDKDTIIIKTKVSNWVERYSGIAKKAWKGIDTTKYLEDLRNEWNLKV